MKGEDLDLREFLEQFVLTAEMDQQRVWVAPMKV